MSESNPPTDGGPSTPPPLPPLPPVPSFAPAAGMPGGPVPPQSTSNPSGAMSVVAIALAGVALVLSFMGPAAFLAWFFALPAFILGIIATVRKAQKRKLAVAAIVVSTLAFLISIVVFFVSLATAVDDAFEEVGTSATVKEETTADAIDGAVAEEPATDGDDTATDSGASTGTFDNPVDVGVVWAYDASWFGEDAAVWDGVVDGVVTTDVWEYSDEVGQCYVIVGTVTPTSLSEGENFSSWIDTPSFSLVIGGSIQDGYGACDTDAVEAAGYGPMSDAEVAVGTEYAYFKEIFVPEKTSGTPDLVVVGDASSDDAFYIKATPLEVS